jgi:hypothetical protein
MSLHKEIHFETEICDDLAANGWLCETGDGTKYGSAMLAFSERLNSAEGGKSCDRAGCGRWPTRSLMCIEMAFR